MEITIGAKQQTLNVKCDCGFQTTYIKTEQGLYAVGEIFECPNCGRKFAVNYKEGSWRAERIKA
jgi:hypothetical protein